MTDYDRLTQVDHFLERERTTEARRLLHEGLQQAPDDPEYLVRLGRSDLIDGDNTGGREHLEAALAVAPDHVAARYLLAAVHVDEEEYGRAEEVLVDLLREDPTDAEVLSLYSRTMLLSLHFEKAERLAEEAIRNDPDNPEALRAVTLVSIVKGDRARRAAALQELLANHPDDERVARLLLHSLIEEGRHRDAQILAQELLVHDPDDTDLVDIIIELRTVTHPASWPCYPFVKWGWTGSAVLWGAFVLGMPLVRRTMPEYAGVIAVSYIALVVYSWTYQPVLRRYLRWRGV